MTYGLWLSAAGLQVNEYRQTLAANNIANVDTVGFKRDLALIHQRQIESAADPRQQLFSKPLLDDLGGGIWVRPTYTSFDQGDLETTDNPFDTAIFGDGFFTVSDGDQTRYTRDGRFTLGDDGVLRMVTGEGRFKVLDSAGNPIRIDTAQGEPTIGKDGVIRQGDAEVARLGLVQFADTTELRKTGENVFEYLGKSSPAPADGQVVAGQVERSTVKPADALTNMIEVARAYELNARMIQLQDETLNQAVNRIGRIG